MGAYSVDGGLETTRLAATKQSVPVAKPKRKDPVVVTIRRRNFDWQTQAVCRDEDPELFFAVGVSGPALLQVEQAKAVCRRCDVVDDCLTWALESGQDAGVWGGMSEEERRAFKRRGGLQVGRS